MMKKTRNTPLPKTANTAGKFIIANVCEPNDPSGNPKATWLVWYRHNELSKEYEIKIRFWTRSGKMDSIIIPARDRSEFGKIRRELCARDARLPIDPKLSVQFVIRVMAATPKDAVEVVSKPGFRDDAKAFVMPGRMYGSAEGRFLWDANFSDPAFGEIKGDLTQYREGVLKPALASPFVSFAILIALAAPLPSYTEQKDGRRKLLPEGAIFHWAGESSSGKTLLACITQSVFGSADITTDYEATQRGVAEVAYARNDLVVVLDDTESGALSDGELLKVMKLFGQRLPSGRSKAIAKSAGGGAFPPLTWFCFGVSTGPQTLAEIARRIGSQRFGERVRFLEMVVPQNAQGGIFGAALSGAHQRVEDSGELISMIEDAISENHGVLFDAWVEFLLSNDQSAQVRSLVDEFVEMTAGGENGLETRIARKFGVMYAAGLIAVEAGLLPWSADWVSNAVRYCYDLARSTRDPDAAAVKAGLKAIARALKIEKRIPLHDAAERTTPLLPDAALGLGIKKDQKWHLFICPDRLGLVGIKDPRVKRLVMEKARELRLIIPSNNASSSVQIRVRTSQGNVEKLRFWKLRRYRTLAWAAHHGMRI